MIDKKRLEELKKDCEFAIKYGHFMPAPDNKDLLSLIDAELSRSEVTTDAAAINELVEQAHNNAKKHGWWDDPRSFGELIALCHSELSEALEDFRAGRVIGLLHYEITLNGDKPCGVPSELADVVIRVFDMCGYYGIDLGKAINEKMKYNEGRPFKHGGKTI